MRAFLGLAAVAAAPFPAAGSPTWARDVAPIVHRQCAPCHREGEAGPFPLLGYADAKKRAGLIAQVAGDRVMPPWKPDPGHGQFRDERRLTPAEIEVLQAWAAAGAAAGAPEGNPADAPAPPAFPTGWQLGPPDVVLRMPEPFAVPAEGPDVYHQFVFPLNLPADTYLRGIEVRPGNRRVAHHAAGILDASGAARKLDARTPEPGYPGLTPGFLPAGFTPGFVPGQKPRFLDPDTAIPIKKGTDFVLQMHYHPTGKVETDLTEVGLHLTTTPPKRGVLMALLGSEEIDIPAGESAYPAKDKWVLPVDMEVRSVWAHMHMIGKRVHVWAEPPDGGRKELLKISDWDFNWQDTYVYAQPFVLPRGTVLRAEFGWDNSADNPRNPFSPPRRVRLGEGSTDEMSGVILGGVSVRREDEGAHWAGVAGHYLAITSKGWKYKRR